MMKLRIADCGLTIVLDFGFQNFNVKSPMKACGGFTLIEVLLGSVISAILLAALYAVFQGLLQTQSRANAGLEEVVPRGQVMLLMKSDIENIVAPNSLLCGNVFGEHDGDADHCSDTLEFSTTSGKPAGTMPWGEVQKVVYYLEPSDDKEAGSNLQLVRSVTRNLLSMDAEDEQEITVLLNAVQSLEFQYFDGQVWQEAWDSTTMNNTPPKAVRIRILLPSEHAKGGAAKPIDMVCEVAARPGPRETGAPAAPATPAAPTSSTTGATATNKAASILGFGFWGLGFGVWESRARNRARNRKKNIYIHDIDYDHHHEVPSMRRTRTRDGMVLVIVLWIVLGLASIVLLFAEGMRMEYQASANGIVSVEAGQAVEGARRYLAYVLDNYATPGALPENDTFEVEDVPVGDAVFWVIGRSAEELTSADTPEFGLVDEASKLNLNTATREMIELLPSMTPDVAAAILDWRNSAADPQPDGAESQTYMAGDPAYQCKNAPFESVEELRLVKGVTKELLYGRDANRNGILDPNEEMADGTDPVSTLPTFTGNAPWRGLLDFVTVWSREPNRRTNGLPRVDVRRPKNAELDALLQEKLGAGRAAKIEAAVNPQAASIGSVLEFCIVGELTPEEAPLIEDALTAHDGTYIPGLVNVNTAPREVLVCLPGIGEKYADPLITTRQTKVSEALASVMWVMEVLDRQSAILAGPHITTRSFQVSADIAAAGRYGRALRRSWMVFDTMESKSVVVYRADETYLGWPLGASWREVLDTSAHGDIRDSGRVPERPGKGAP